MFHIVISAHNVSRSNEYAFNVPQGSYQRADKSDLLISTFGLISQ